EQAIRAARQLKVRWKDWQGLPPLEPDRLEDTLRRHPKKPRTLHDSPGLEQHLAGIARPLSATYVWPYQLHASIGPSCALAEVDAQRARVWSGTQNPHDLRNDLARLLQRETGDIEVIRMEAAGCYGRNSADDVSADAVLLAQAVGRPVRVQLM
ncbi:molybdopterin-dependent oxidoreductase, partial [Morganella morganii]